MIPDTWTSLGLGDLDSTSGAGMTFVSICLHGHSPDGSSVIAYHDSTDPDPLFAVGSAAEYIHHLEIDNDRGGSSNMDLSIMILVAASAFLAAALTVPADGLSTILTPIVLLVLPP